MSEPIRFRLTEVGTTNREAILFVAAADHTPTSRPVKCYVSSRFAGATRRFRVPVVVGQVYALARFGKWWTRP